ncbi:copper resistance CopC/CopD family protein [Neobacillus jeddahensis]|uniref:copper resistance CopC/CopD family protein n=1 Tax=Neobacillus jeddahensis TaxID=1461580 RepID=UPI00058D13DC|nr:copper resistance protein CopC [Neobacillus jeddahensis]
MKVIKPFRYILLFILLLSLGFPQAAFAHAVLEKVVPVQDSHLQSSPKEITLTFNERLESEFFTIKVFDESGEEISGNKAKLSVDHKQLSRPLPKLTDGNYTVSYQVISADGHPVKGSYIFSVGAGFVGNSKVVEFQTENQGSPLTSIGRIIYYLALLLTTGWIWWGAWVRKHLEESEQLKQSYKNKGFLLLMAFLLANIGFGAIIASGYLEQWNLSSLIALITDTTAGQSWSISMILSLLSFVILFRSPWVDRVWLLLLLAAKSVNGHAFAFEPKVITVSLDFIHLLAASIWSGGLLYILMYLKKFPAHVRNFMRRYSFSALISMVVLIGSGLISTFMYLPKIEYLFVTKWGTLLLIKMALVLLVLVVAGAIRFFLKKRTENSIRNLIKLDFILMLSITCIVGILTFLIPIPENKPLDWHEKAEGMDFTTSISPKVPGTNAFMVEANSNEVGLGIKRIELNIINKDNPDVAPIHVPLEAYGQGDYAHFMTEGSYLPFAGNWTAEVRILDTEDNEKVYRKDFVVY